MGDVDFMKTKLADARTLLDIAYTRIKSNPDDFITKYSICSLESHCKELQKSINEEYLVHGKEIVELRLRGKTVNSGRVPLDTMAGIMSAFSKAVQYASVKIQNGEETIRRIPKDVTNFLAPSFAANGLGSSRLYLTLDSNANLFGESLAETVLKNTFDVLGQNTDEDFFESIELLGIKSLKHWRDVFKYCLQEKVDLEIKWMDINTKQLVWDSDKNKLRNWRSRIDTIQSRSHSQQKHNGTISLLSLSGRIEIKTEEKTIRAVYPIKMQEEISTYHIGQQVRCVYDVKEVVDLRKGSHSLTYTLSSITEELEK